MGLISSISNSARGAAGRTAATAEDAKTLGFTNVQTHYEPQTGHHTVTGEPPKAPDAPSGRGLFRR